MARTIWLFIVRPKPPDIPTRFSNWLRRVTLYRLSFDNGLSTDLSASLHIQQKWKNAGRDTAIQTTTPRSLRLFASWANIHLPPHIHRKRRIALHRRDGRFKSVPSG